VPQVETIGAAPDLQTLYKLRLALTNAREETGRPATPQRRATLCVQSVPTNDWELLFPSTPHSGQNPVGFDLFGFVNNNRMRGKR